MSTIKKTIRVTIVKDLQIEIINERLTPEALKEFSDAIYGVSDPLEVFECAAQQIARFEPTFVEGIGPARPYYSSDKDGIAVRWTEVNEEIETEEVKP
jgi:hypothetical protein